MLPQWIKRCDFPFNILPIRLKLIANYPGIPSVYAYRIILLDFSNLSARRFPNSQDIDDFLSDLIPPYGHPPPRNQKSYSKKQKRDPQKGSNHTKSQACPHHKEYNPEYTKDQGCNPPSITE